MKAELNKKTSEFEITISPEQKIWTEAIKKAEKGLFENLSVKGFRKGKVPTDIAKKHVSETDVMSKAMWEVLEPLAKEASKHIPKDIMVLDSPIYHPMVLKKDKLEIKFTYPVYPDVDIKNYKNLDLNFEEKKVDNKTVDAEIENILNNQTMLKTKDGKIEKGDTADFNFEGFIDNKPFEGGKAENYQLEIGSGQFIIGFEDQMIGLKAGDEKAIKISFPKDYQTEKLKGKNAEFKVKVNSVKIKNKPKLDAEFVKSLGIDGVKTVEELKKYVKKVFTEQERQQARAKFQREAFDKILKDAKFVVPKSLIAKETKALIGRFEQQLKQQNMELKQYMKMTNLDSVKLEAQFKDQAETRLRDSLVYAEIARQEKIEIKENEYEEEYKKLAQVYNQTVEGVKGTITKAQMQIPMTNDRVIDVLIKNIKR